MVVWARRTIYLLLLVVCLGCGSDDDAPANIPIVLSNGRFGEAETTVAATVAPVPITADAPTDATAQGVAPTPRATVEVPANLTVSPTRTLTETLEELLTPVIVATADATADATNTAVGDATVGALRVTVLGVRVAALDASLTNEGDNRALVVRARFENPTDRAIFLQVGSDTTLRDAAGTAYAPDFIARTSAQAREPDALVTPGGSVEGEIAYQVPNTATTFEWIVRSGGTQSSVALPNVPAGAPEAEPSASAAPPAETVTPE